MTKATKKKLEKRLKRDDTPMFERNSAEFAYLEDYRNAAFIYCKSMNIEPEIEIATPDPKDPVAEIFRPQWHLVAEDMFDLSLKLGAMKTALMMKTETKH